MTHGKSPRPHRPGHPEASRREKRLMPMIFRVAIATLLFSGMALSSGVLAVLVTGFPANNQTIIAGVKWGAIILFGTFCAKCTTELVADRFLFARRRS